MDARAFSEMKPSAYFINMGRGELVDEDALLQTLKARRIAGAALDCFRQEPLPKKHPFWKLDNLILTPHVGGASDINVQQAVRIIRENLKHFLKGNQNKMINIIPRIDS
jgi:phosphoglycerate dehydrogenase-like enzyme